MSMLMTSGLSSRAFCTTSSPSRAAPTNSIRGPIQLHGATSASSGRESSATNTRIRFTELNRQGPEDRGPFFQTSGCLVWFRLTARGFSPRQQHDHPLVASTLPMPEMYWRSIVVEREAGGGAMSLLARFNTSRTESTSKPRFHAAQFHDDYAGAFVRLDLGRWKRFRALITGTTSRAGW